MLEPRQMLSTATPAAVNWAVYPKLLQQDLAVSQFPNINGSGITVAVIDRGIDYNHPQIGAGKILTGLNFRDNSGVTLDDYGHGTGVAGIIAADGYTMPDGTYNQGVAPGVKIIDLKQESSAGCKAALDWVIANRAAYNIQVVNLTDFVTDVLPGAWNPTTYLPELQTLHDMGVFISTPAGNGEVQYGPNAPMTYPSLSPYLTAVGGFDQSGGMYADSLRGPALDVLGPADNVTMPYYVKSNNPGYDQYDDNYTGTPVLVNYARGTSWGSAYTAGTAALIKQINQSITPDQIQQILKDSGTQVADPENPGVYYARINIDQALILAMQRYGVATPPPAQQGVFTLGANVNASKFAGSESTPQIAINPTNPNNIVIVSQSSENGGAQLPFMRSTDGGKTWTTTQVGWQDGQNLGNPRPDAHVAFDSFGNLYMTYEVASGPQIWVVVLRSTDGGASFVDIGNAVSGTGFDPDAPWITTGRDAANPALQHIWVSFTDYTSNRVMISGGTSSALGQFSGFSTPKTVSQSFGTFSSVAVGPNGEVAVSWQSDDSGNVVANFLKINVDTTGTGNSFSADRLIANVNVGGFDRIPAQPDRSVDAEPRIAFDRSGGPANGRLYVVYINQPPSGSDTDVYLKYSSDFGATWNTPVRVNDDDTTNSQFNPAIAIDQTNGNVGISWLDARNSPTNTGVQAFATVSLDHGASVQPNVQVSAGTSFQAGADPNSNDLDFGDSGGLAFNAGKLIPVWSDNSNSTGDNPGGTGKSLDVYADVITVNTAAPPVVLSAAFDQTAQTLTFQFSKSVTPSFTTADISLVNVSTATPTTVPAGFMSLVYDTNTNTATIRFPGYTNSKLPDGHYVVTLNAAGISDSSGVAMANNYGFDFISFTPAAPTVTATTGYDMHLTLPATLAGTNGYVIQRADGTGGAFATVGSVAAGVTSYDDTGLTPKTIYTYRIAAASGQAISAFSATRQRMTFEQGDVDGNYTIDFFDIVALLASHYNTGQPATWADGDQNGDGVVDFFDLTEILAANYNTGPYYTPPPDGAAQAAPAEAMSVAAAPAPAAAAASPTSTATASPSIPILAGTPGQNVRVKADDVLVRKRNPVFA
jgi:hypothetical protein